MKKVMTFLSMISKSCLSGAKVMTHFEDLHVEGMDAVAVDSLTLGGNKAAFEEYVVTVKRKLDADDKIVTAAKDRRIVDIRR